MREQLSIVWEFYIRGENQPVTLPPHALGGAPNPDVNQSILHERA